MKVYEVRRVVYKTMLKKADEGILFTNKEEAINHKNYLQQTENEKYPNFPDKFIIIEKDVEIIL